MTFRYWANAETRSSTRYQCPVRGCPQETVVFAGPVPECPGHGRAMVPVKSRRAAA